MQIRTDARNPRGFVVEIYSGNTWRRVADDGSFSFVPDHIIPDPAFDFAPNSLINTGGKIELWGGITTNAGTEGCVDPSTTGSTLAFADITQNSLGSFEEVTSALPDWPMPTINRYGRVFPYRLDLGGERLLFSTSADHVCETLGQPGSGDPIPWPGYSPFRGMEILLTVLDGPDPAPVPDFEFDCQDRVCTFDASSSTDNRPIPAGGYAWDFGDGQTGSGKIVVHTYAADDAYSVTLTVTDDSGQPASKTQPVLVATGCVPTSRVLCLQDSRFKVEVDFTSSTSGQGVAIPFSGKSGFFRFGNPASIEVGVKILDGRASNGHWWVFHGSLTSVEYTLKITDTETDAIELYHKPASPSGPPCGGADTSAFPNTALGARISGGHSPELEGLDLAPTPSRASSCTAGAGRICLIGNRFKVEVKKSGFNQNGTALTDSSGTFWFSDSANVEVPVKIIDGTAVNDKFWVFFGSLTSQAYQVVVTDTATGQSKTYDSDEPFCGNADTGAF